MIAFLCIYFLISHIQMVYPSFDECGISYNEVADRLIHQVVGGHRSSLGSWPWVVAIYANGKKICTGSIISRNYVLTAAHCKILNQGSNDEIIQFSIHAGSILASGGGGIVIDVEDVKIFDEFYSPDSIPNDIALLQLKTPLTLNENIQKICLPKSYLEIPLNNAILAGFGELDWRSNDLTNFRMIETSIPFQHFDHCQRFIKEWNYTSQNYICLGAHNRGSGRGDSGGPFMVKLEGQNGPRWFEVGIVVGAYYQDMGSKRDWSHIASTRVSVYCGWIEENTNGEAKCIDVKTTNNPAKRCLEGWVYNNVTNYCYLFSNLTMDFMSADNYCQNEGGYLASIHSDAEGEFIDKLSLKYLSRYGMIWIGLRSTGSDYSNQSWIDGTPLNYSNWYPFWGTTKALCPLVANDPLLVNDNPPGFQGFMCSFFCTSGSPHIATSKTYWCNNYPCDTKKNFICKQNPIY